MFAGPKIQVRAVAFHSENFASSADNWPRTTISQSRPRALPSTLRRKLRETIQEVSSGDLQEGQSIRQECEKCSALEMTFVAVQLHHRILLMSQMRSSIQRGQLIWYN